MARRFHLTLVLAAAIGVVTGLGVAGFDRVVQPAPRAAARRSRCWSSRSVPAAGLVVVNVINALWGDGDTATTDAYVRAYHRARRPPRAAGAVAAS